MGMMDLATGLSVGFGPGNQIFNHKRNWPARIQPMVVQIPMMRKRVGFLLWIIFTTIIISHTNIVK